MKGFRIGKILLCVFCGMALFFSVSPPLVADSSVSASAKKTSKRKKVKTQLKKVGLAKIPEISGMLAAKSKKVKSSSVRASDVSGNPPALVEIPELGIENVFWREGVIEAINNGTATPDQCGEFWSGEKDGASGGLGACHMAESVGYSFESIMRSGSTLCYMKHIPTQKNVDAGAVSLVSGSLPEGGVTRLFSAGSEPRLIKVNVTGDGGPEGEGGGHEGIFIRVPSQAQNNEAAALYQVDVWFCEESVASGYNSIEIEQSGRFVAVQAEGNQGESEFEGESTHKSSAVGFLTVGTNGDLTFDPSKSRSADVSFVSGEGFFKGHVEISANNTLLTKFYHGGTFTNLGASATRFSGSGVSSLRFLEGAFKGRNVHNSSNDSFAGATEYRNSYYAAAPENSLKAKLSDINFDTDEFFLSEPNGYIDTSEFSCSSAPDIVVTVDMSNPVFWKSIAPCEQRLDGMNFCHDSETVSQAQGRFFDVCAPQPPSEHP